MPSLIEINNMSFSYSGINGEFPVFNNLNLLIEKGEKIGLIGANGAGKSTFLRILIGLLSDFTGKINIDTKELNRKNVDDIREKVGYVFQDSDSQLFMSTVWEDVAFGPQNKGLSEEEVNTCVKEALIKTRIENLASKQVFKLSGGQKKLASIATVLSMKPEIILMDEPSVALDPANRENLVNVLRSLKNTQIIASHDLDFIYDTCDRVILLSNGVIVADGTTDDILKNKYILENNGLRLPLSFRFRN